MADLQNHYTIGEYQFDSYHEYRDGQEDVKKIDAINDRLDIKDPETSVRLYNMIRNGEITFRTKIGEDFFDHVADIVAQGSEGLLEDKVTVETAEGKVRYQRMAGIAVAVFAVALFAYFGISEFHSYYETRQIAKVQKSVTKSTEDEAITYDKANEKIDTSEQEIERNPYRHEELIDESTLEVLPEYADLVAQNDEMVGWLTIPQTPIDYPVMQRENDNEFYLKHAFDKSELAAGTLFADYRSDTVNPTTNTIIYGHYMRNGTMFGTLEDYLDETYYNEHKMVNFNTIYEHRTYEVVAVCLSKVEYQDENSYRYYNFIQAGNRAEWDAFVKNVKKLSVFGDDVDLSMNQPEEVLTLSTCNYYVQDGRMFLVAKRISQ